MKKYIGYDFENNIKSILSNLNNKHKTLIITENKEYIEDILLDNYNILFNIEIKTLKEYQYELLLSQMIYNRKLLSKSELTYKIRSLLKNNHYQFFKLNDNPYNFINVIIDTLMLIHNNNLDLISTSHDKLSQIKCSELKDIDNKIEGYFTLEEMTYDLIQYNSFETIYIIGDDYLNKSQITFINELDHYCDMHIIISMLENEVLNHYYKGDIILNKSYPLSLEMFSFNKTSLNTPISLITGGDIYQEVLKVTSDIKDKLVHLNIKLNDILIVTPSSQYNDYLKTIFDNWGIAHNIPTINDYHLDNSYKLIVETLDKCTLNTFKDISHELLKLKLDESYSHIISSLLYDDTIDTHEYLLFLESLLNNKEESLDNEDIIHVSSFTNKYNVKYIYIMGLNETITPSIVKETTLLLEEDYISLNKKPFYLNDQAKFIEMNIIKTLSQNASFIFSYAFNDMDGKELMSSTLINRLKDICHVNILNPSLNLHTQYLYMNNLRIPSLYTNELIDLYNQSKNNTTTIDENLRSLLGKGMSVSRLETYNKCPFMYYIKYGLKINPISEDKLLPHELGSLAHYMMEKGLEDINNAKAYGYEYVNSNLHDKYNNEINKFFIDRLIDDMILNIKIVSMQLDNGEFNASFFEKEIKGFINDIPLFGIIDRVDTFNDYIRIIDYKSGNKDLNLNYAMQGFNIQMLLYLDLLIKDKQYKPGATLYYSLKRRILTSKIDKNLSLNKDINEELYYKNFKMNGYLIDEDNYKVAHASDINSIPFDFKNDGSPKANSHVISSKVLHNILDEIKDYITKLYNELYEGIVEIKPTKSDNNTPEIYPCTFCPYDEICLYDVFFNENKIIESKYKSEIIKGED